MINKLGSQRFKIIVLLIILLILGLIFAIGWVVLKNHQSKLDNTSRSSSKYITVLGKKLPLADCDKAKLLLRKELSGDICYIGNFAVDGEVITYIKVNQSKSYLEDFDKNCSMDCGGGIPIPGDENIIRANGAVEYATTDWANRVEPSIDYLTGCGTGKFSQLDSFEGQGKFIKNEGKIAVASSLKNVKIPDDYGNQCNISAKLISYTSSDKQLIKQLSVNYQLKGIDSCIQDSEPEGCYTAQATMRNDLQLCDKAVDPQYPTDGSDYCIESMAKHRLDVVLCEKLNMSRNVCQHDAQELKEMFQSKLVIN